MRGRNLRFESLESRHLLTAVVTEVDGVVTIQGDETAEDVVITQTATNEFSISGEVEDENGSPGPLTFSNVTAFNIDLAGEGDSLTINGNGELGLLADLDIDMGTGGDIVDISNLRLQGALNIVGEAVDGPDVTQITLDQVRADGGATIQTGAGNDTFNLVDSRFRGGFELSASAGDDVAAIDGFRSRNGDTTFDFGLGLDELSLVDARIRGDLEIFGGDDNEDAFLLTLAEARVRGNLTIEGGGGDDDIAVLDLRARQGAVDVDTLGGDDDVSLEGSRVRAALSIDLGDDDDDLALLEGRFRGAVAIDGGSGQDSLLRSTSRFRGGVSVQNVENDDDD